LNILIILVLAGLVIYLLFKLGLYIYRSFYLQKMTSKIEEQHNKLLARLNQDVDMGVENYNQWQSGDITLGLESGDELKDRINEAMASKKHAQEVNEKFIRLRERYLLNYKKSADPIFWYMTYLDLRLNQFENADIYSSALSIEGATFDEFVISANEQRIPIEENERRLDALLDSIFSSASAQQKQSEPYDQAISEYTKAIELNPNSAEAYYHRGFTYGEKGQYDQAISDYNKALEINPRYAEAHVYRGFAYGEKGQYDQEISDYNKALEINSKDAEAYYHRGFTYGEKGQYDQAISDYNKTLEINPRYAEAYYNRGVAYCFKREYEKSWEDVKKAQSLGCQIHPEFLDRLRKESGRQN